MKRNTLPSLIIALMSVLFLAVISVVWISLFSVRQQMDAEAADESERLMIGRISALQAQVSLIASDYHNWTDLFLNAQQLEYNKLASNYGITAERGDVFQYAELFDGPFPKPISWREGLGLHPQNGFITPAVHEALRERIQFLDSTQRQTVDYFEFSDEQLVMFSASLLLPEDELLLVGINLELQAIGAIGKILSKQYLSGIEKEFSLSDLKVVTDAPIDDVVHISVLDVTGEPVAWLEWLPPKPGTLLFRKMFPIMSWISIAFVLISFFAARLLLGKAKAITEQEAISFEKARIDALTGLPNRYAFLEHLGSLSQLADAKYAVLAIDLVRFKQINDTVGHVGGDAFLVEFSRRLAGLVDETTFVSRYGGDEFFIAICTSSDFGTVVREKCRELSKISFEPIKCKGVTFEALSSKGIATSRLMDQEDLICRADRAMYSAKKQRTQEVVFYDGEMESEDLEYKLIEAQMRRALVKSNEFQIHYQPIVSARDPKKILRYEALARWSSPKLGPVDVEKFIHVAETSGLILPLGWALLDLICAEIKKFEHICININISPAQLMTPGFAVKFADKVVANGCHPTQIEIEVTEQVVVLDDITIAKELSILHDKGFKLALDDFGTGYSSIGYLTRMPFDVLKIDRSFIQTIHQGQRSARILKAIVGLARSMDLEVVVEGIQAKDDIDALRAMGVDYFQGYLFGKPASLTEIRSSVAIV
ncbi:putative bifunctional diguanylate cyclase/phosphodiesterase [Roseobacter sp.]|uniref:putative bifunctional diguanylate cyclase/phosphodiesterase n=1 Tax=Roseobacter sp. TaxID=1907202 RepID=UPI00385AFE0C